MDEPPRECSSFLAGAGAAEEHELCDELDSLNLYPPVLHSMPAMREQLQPPIDSDDGEEPVRYRSVAESFSQSFSALSVPDDDETVYRSLADVWQPDASTEAFVSTAAKLCSRQSSCGSQSWAQELEVPTSPASRADAMPPAAPDRPLLFELPSDLFDAVLDFLTPSPGTHTLQ